MDACCAMRRLLPCLPTTVLITAYSSDIECTLLGILRVWIEPGNAMPTLCAGTFSRNQKPDGPFLAFRPSLSLHRIFRVSAHAIGMERAARDRTPADLRLTPATTIEALQPNGSERLRNAHSFRSRPITCRDFCVECCLGVSLVVHCLFLQSPPFLGRGFWGGKLSAGRSVPLGEWPLNLLLKPLDCW
jgi:hypothetical protein